MLMLGIVTRRMSIDYAGSSLFCLCLSLLLKSGSGTISVRMIS
jgi:hypothetical protein